MSKQVAAVPEYKYRIRELMSPLSRVRRSAVLRKVVEKTKVSAKTYYEWCNIAADSPRELSFETISAFAEALGCSIAELVRS